MNGAYTNDLWHAIHIFAYTTTNEKKGNYLEFLKILHSMVCCTIDQSAFTDYINTTPVDDLSVWVYGFHKKIASIHHYSIPSMISTQAFYRSDLLTKDVWGAYGWKMLHRLSATSTRLELFKNLLPLFFDILPCPICKEHAPAYLKENPLPKNIHEYFKWTVDFHNNVSARLNETNGTRRHIFTVEEARGTIM